MAVILLCVESGRSSESGNLGVAANLDCKAESGTGAESGNLDALLNLGLDS